MRPRASTLVVASLLFLTIWIGVGLAISGGVGVSGTVTIDASDGPTVDVVTNGGELRLDGPDGPNTVDVEHDSGNITLESTGQTTASVNTNELGPGRYSTVRNIDTQSTNLTITRPSARPITVGGSITRLSINETIVDGDGAADLTYNASGSSTISIPGLEPDKNYVLRDVDTNQVVALTRADSSGTAVFNDPDVGQHNVEVGDYVIEIREIAPNNPLVDNVNVEFRIYQEGTDRIFVRNSTTGRITTGDLPQDSAYSITVKSDGYVTRQTFIEDPRRQQTVYLLNNSSTSQIVRFNIDDRTGDFNENVRVQVERSINTSSSPNDEERFQVVAGEIVGSQLEFQTVLEKDVRYRISVANARGDERQLGSFLIKSDQIIDLVISGINVGYSVPDDGPQINATQTVNETSGDKSLRLFVQDPSQGTTNVQIDVVDFANRDDVIDSGFASGPIGEFSYSTTVSGADADKRLVAVVTYQFEGDEVTTVVPFGGSKYSLLPGLDPDWRAIFGVGFLLVLGGVFSVANARIGALVIPGAALALNLTGILSTVVTTTSIGLAFAVAVGINIIRGSGDILR